MVAITLFEEDFRVALCIRRAVVPRDFSLKGFRTMKRWKDVIWTQRLPHWKIWFSLCPWKQMSYFWSIRNHTSSWCLFTWAMKVVSSHPIDKVTQVEAQSWQSTVIPRADPCLLCCCAALSCLTANWHKKEARHLAESTLCQGWEGHCKQHFAVLWLHWGTRIAETFTAVPAEAHFSSLSLLSTDLNKVPFDRY